MKLGNLPIRAYRKRKKSGNLKLFEEIKNTIITDYFLYELLYKNSVQDWIDIIYSEEILETCNCEQYDDIEGLMRRKGTGFRGLKEPKKYDPVNRFACEVSNATILGPVGVGLTSDGSVLSDTVGPHYTPRRIGISLSKSMAMNGIRKTKRALRGQAVQPDNQYETVAVAIPTWNNYYHWTIECLIRIRLLEKYGSHRDEYPILLVPKDKPEWMDESLRIVDYEGKTREWEDGIAIANQLIVPTFPDPVQGECFWLRDRMRNKDSSEGDARRVYIARDDATVRRVANRDAVQRVLKQYDIDTYVLSELSVREQIDLFSSAELVVGPHGAGLTNIVFGDDLTVIEFFGDKKMATFDRIAESMNHDYHFIECEQRLADIVVDVDALSKKLESLL